MENTDPRWTRSRAQLLDAISRILDSGRVPSITDVVSSAGVSRPTFYQHFGDIRSACTHAALERIQREFARIQVPHVSEVDDAFIVTTVTDLLGHLLEHRPFYRTVLHHAGTREFSEAMVAFLADRIVRVSPLGAPFRSSTPHSADRVTALAAGLFWLITHWLDEETPAPAPEMATRVLAVMPPVISAKPALSN